MLQSNDYALVMGVDDYEKHPLKGPVRDAKLFAKWLTDKQHGGGLPDQNCYIVLNPDSPVGSMITITLEKIVIQIEKAREEGRLPRRFYLYFSGHGQSAHFSDVNLCMKLWAPTRPLSLSSTKCLDEIINCCNFQEVAIFLDCCRTATTSIGYHPGLSCGQTPSYREPGTPATRMFQAYSSEYLAKSYEGEVAHRSDSSPNFGGFFTKALLDALYGAAADASGGIRPESLCNYLEMVVPQLASQHKREVQKPQFNIGFSSNAVFGCALPKTDARKVETRSIEKKGSLQVSLHYHSSINPLDIEVTVYNKSNQKIYLGQAPVNIEVPQGKYFVQWSCLGTLNEIVTSVPQTQPQKILVKRFTPAPVPGTAHYHEYYSSLDQTILHDERTGDFSNCLQATNSRLYILMRARNRESYRGEDLAQGLELLDENLTPLFKLSEYSRFDQQFGSLLCSLPYPPGFYFLRYVPLGKSGQARLFPVHIYEGWQSRLFFFHEYGQPDFMNVSMSLLPISYQHNDDAQFSHRQQVDTVVDFGLTALQQNSEHIPHTVSQSWQDQPLKNPFLAILQSHFLLKQTPNSQVHTTLLSTLAYLRENLPASPDLLALQYGAFLHYPNDNDFQCPNQVVRNVPMLRASQQILLRAGLKMNTIERKSNLENLSPYLYLDTPWTTFRPREDAKLFTIDLPPSYPTYNPPDAYMPENVPPEYASLWGKNIESLRELTADFWLLDTLKEIIQLSEITGQNPDWENLSLELGIPLRKLNDLQDELQK
jgi:hypothetical protein